MTLQFSVAVRNAMLDAIASTNSGTRTLKLFSGSPPASCADADTGTNVANISYGWASASNGQLVMNGTMSDSNTTDNSRVDAGYFRLYGDGTCHIQGTVSATGGGGDMTMSKVYFEAGSYFTIASFTLTEGNA